MLNLLLARFSVVLQSISLVLLAVYPGGSLHSILSCCTFHSNSNFFSLSLSLSLFLSLSLSLSLPLYFYPIRNYSSQPLLYPRLAHYYHPLIPQPARACHSIVNFVVLFYVSSILVYLSSAHFGSSLYVMLSENKPTQNTDNKTAD